LRVGFETPLALLALALVPLLILQDRRTNAVKRVAWPFLPLLGQFIVSDADKPPLLLRLNKRKRLYLRLIVVVLLSLASASAYFVLSYPNMGKLLVLIDNVASSSAVIEKKTTLELIKNEVADLVRSKSYAEIEVWVSSPALGKLFSTKPGLDAPLDMIDETTSIGSIPVEKLIKGLSVIKERGRYDRRIVIFSPRATMWQEALGDLPSFFHAKIPGNAAASGNWGITRFSVAPSKSTGNGYDLFFKAGSYPLGEHKDAVQAMLRDGEGIKWRGTVSSEQEIQVEGIVLAPGKATLFLEVNDSFAYDNKVDFEVLPQATGKVYLGQSPPPFLKAALEAMGGFTEAEGRSEATVNIFIGTPPEENDTPALVLRPVKPFWGFKNFTQDLDAGHISTDPTHPITDEITLEALDQMVWINMAPPPGHRVLAKAGDSPLITAGETNGARVVVWNFDPFEGMFPLLTEMPLLIKNSLTWLSGGEGAVWSSGVRPDEPFAPAAHGKANVLSPEISKDAAVITIPARGWADEIMLEEDDNAYRMDLSPYLLAAALLLIVYGACVNCYSPGLER